MQDLLPYNPWMNQVQIGVGKRMIHQQSQIDRGLEAKEEVVPSIVGNFHE